MSRTAPEDAKNPFKGTGLVKLVIGEPYAPNTGNWIYVTVYQLLIQENVRQEIKHQFRVADVSEVIPTAIKMLNVAKDRYGGHRQSVTSDSP